MVKKISGTPPGGSGSTGPVEGTKAVGTTKVANVGEVGATQEQGKAKGVRQGAVPLTAADRELLFSLIHEEADRMFAEGALPPKKKETVEGAVKMAVNASIIDEE